LQPKSALVIKKFQLKRFHASLFGCLDLAAFDIQNVILLEMSYNDERQRQHIFWPGR